MKKLLALFLILSSAGAAPLRAAEGKTAWSWISANEYYMMLPAAQRVKVDGGGTHTAQPWAAGLRAVAQQRFSQTAGLQLESVRLDRPAAVRANFYLLSLLWGMQYTSPKRPSTPLRFTAAGMGEFGLSGGTLYIAPVITAGLLYTTDDMAITPTGFTLGVFCRPLPVDLDDVGGGRSGTLKPAVGLKVGYVFQGFWSPKEKTSDRL